MDGNEGVSIPGKFSPMFTRVVWFNKSVIIVLAITFITSFCLRIYWSNLLLPLSFAIGCGAAVYLLKNSNKFSLWTVGWLRTSFASYPRLSYGSDSNYCPAKPWMDLKVPYEIDEAVEEILNLVLERHIYTWYSTLSSNEAFIQEIRVSLRFLISSLLRRALKVDIVHLITIKAANIAFQQLECYLDGKKYANSSNVEASVLQYLGNNLHTAMISRKMELSYLRQLTENVLPHIVQKKYLPCRSARCLVREIFCNLILLPVMDIIADPDIVNHLLILFFDKTPMEEYPESSKPKVELLSNFVMSNYTKEKPLLHTDLKTVLEDQTLLFRFMSFLKEESSINILQFLLSVDEFNSMMLNPDLTKKAIETLHLQAQELYNTYFAPDSTDRINFDENIICELKEIIGGPPENVEKLRTTTPLYQAYDHAYGLLEQVYCPMFLRSDGYLQLICGERNGANSNQNHGKGNKKSNAGPSSISKIGNKLKGVFITNIDDGQLVEDEAGTDLAEALLPDIEVESYNISDSYKMDNDPRLKKLSAWRVFIPQILTGMDQNCKYYHAFHIEVQRIDVQDHDNPEDLHWKLERRYNEFYVLEAKFQPFALETDLMLTN